VAFLIEQAKKSYFFVTHGGCHSTDYVEKVALSLGLEKLFLLTTRTADWYLPLFSSLLCANSIYLCSSLDSLLCANSSNALIFSFLYACFYLVLNFELSQVCAAWLFRVLN